MIATKTVRLGPVTATAGQKNFAYVGKVFVETDWLIWVKLDGTTTWVPKSYPGDYSVSNVGAEAGEIQFVVGLASGDKVVGVAQVPGTQQLKLAAWPVIEEQVDRLTRQINYLEDKFKGALVLDDFEDRLAAPSLEAPVADNYLKWNNTKTKIINAINIAVGVATSVDETDTDATKDKMISNFLTNLFFLLSEVMTGVDVASAVNKFTVTNAAAGNNPKSAVTGGDTNIGYEIQTQGNGDLILGPSSGADKGDAILPEKVDAPIGSHNYKIAQHKNLVTEDITTSTVDIDADEVLLRDASGRLYLAETVNLTVDITNSGANGLDTGAEAANTWYYLWVIYNPLTDTLAGLLSLSETAPTLPADYTFKGLVGAVVNDLGSDFLDYYQEDNIVIITEGQILTNGVATTPTAVAVTAPNIAKEVMLHIVVEANDTVADQKTAFVQCEATGTRGRIAFGAHFKTAPVVGDRAILTSYRLQIKVNQVIYYNVVTAGTRLQLLQNGWTY